MSWADTLERITKEATELKPVKVLVTLLALPFFLLGLLVGIAWAVLALAWQAGWVGAQQAHAKLTPKE